MTKLRISGGGFERDLSNTAFGELIALKIVAIAG
jgi:hypothetical protein